MSGRASQRVIAALAVIAFVVFMATAASLHVTRTDLSPTRHTLSRYLLGPGGDWLVAAYVLQGIALALLGCALASRFSVQVGRRAYAPAAFLCVGGISLAAVGLCDFWWPPANPRSPGVHHYAFAGLAFLGMGVGALWQSLHCVDAYWRRWRRPALFVLGMAIALGVIHRVFDALPVTLVRWPSGLSQKMIIAALLAWVPLMAWALWRSPLGKGDNGCFPELGS